MAVESLYCIFLIWLQNIKTNCSNELNLSVSSPSCSHHYSILSFHRVIITTDNHESVLVWFGQSAF